MSWKSFRSGIILSFLLLVVALVAACRPASRMQTPPSAETPLPTTPYSLSFENIAEIENLSEVALPIDGAQEAISYALKTVATIKSNITAAAAETGCRHWLVRAKMQTREGQPYWRVEITSQGILPKYACVVSLWTNGSVVSEEQQFTFCGYNK